MTTLLRQMAFDQLPDIIKGLLEDSQSHGLLADGTQLPFYGSIRLTIQLIDIKANEVFVVSQLSEDAVLGMLSLTAY